MAEEHSREDRDRSKRRVGIIQEQREFRRYHQTPVVVGNVCVEWVNASGD
jgi:hypothetical protein